MGQNLATEQNGVTEIQPFHALNVMYHYVCQQYVNCIYCHMSVLMLSLHGLEIVICKEQIYN